MHLLLGVSPLTLIVFKFAPVWESVIPLAPSAGMNSVPSPVLHFTYLVCSFTCLDHIYPRFILIPWIQLQVDFHYLLDSEQTLHEELATTLLNKCSQGD